MEADIDEVWHVDSCDQISEAKREDYREDRMNLEYFDRALAETVATVIHTYPRQEVDEG